MRAGDLTNEFDFDLHGGASHRLRLVQLPLVKQHAAEIGVGCGTFRVEFDGLTVAGDGLVELPLVVQGDAEVVVERSALRVEFDGLTVAGDGLVQLPLSLYRRIAEVVVGLRAVSGRVRWPCGSRRWPRPASPDLVQGQGRG